MIDVIFVGIKIRGSTHLSNATWQDVLALVDENIVEIYAIQPLAMPGNSFLTRSILWPRRISLNVLLLCGQSGTRIGKWSMRKYTRVHCLHTLLFRVSLCDLGSLAELKKKISLRRITESEASSWTAPPLGAVKINVDAAVAKNINKGGVADVARSSTGHHMGTSAVIFRGRGDSEESETFEALACREAMRLAADIVATRVQVASDFQSVVKNFHEGRMGAYAHILHNEMKERSSEFQEASCKPRGSQPS
jgi:ribonuclease HI